MKYTALIGYPTSQSPSPHLFSIYASAHGLEYAHLKIDVLPGQQSLKDTLTSFKILGFAGLNVTIPHKLAVIQHLDEVDSFAEKIGAVNTISIKDAKLIGYNTDYIGVRKSVEKALGRPVGKSDNVVVLGSGGAAKACMGAFEGIVSDLTAIYRNPRSKNTIDFLERFSGSVSVYEYTSHEAISALHSANIICNATSVGMSPDSTYSVLDDFYELNESDNKDRLYFDAVYSPHMTKFLSRALKSGAQVAYGVDMMIYQGVEAFRLWTGLETSTDTVDKARSFLLKRLGG